MPKSSRLFVVEGFFVLVIVCVLGTYNSRLPRVTFVLPDDYVGRLEVIKAMHAPDILGESMLDAHVYFPSDGRVEVQSLGKLQRAHRLSCSYRNGKSMPVSFDGPDNATALRLGTFVDNGTTQKIVYIVGTKADEDALINAL